MGNIIKLDISKKLIGVTGRENGRKIAKKQIMPEICKTDLPVQIIFPDNILLVGVSFIEGIEEVLGTKYPPDVIRRGIGYTSKDLSINREARKCQLVK